MLNKCQTSPLLPGVTASPEKSSAGATGTPALELKEFADPGWGSHCLRQSPGTFLGESTARHEMGKESLTL